MKSHLTKISLALLSTVFLLGCQDLGTGVVESDGLGPAFAPKEGKGKPKPPTGQGVLANLTISGGLIATSQPVTLGNGGLIQGEAGDIELEMALSNTHNQNGAGIGACVPFAGRQADAEAENFVTDADFMALFATLKNNTLRLLKSLWLEIDQNTLGQETLEDDFNLTYDEDGEAINVIMGQGLAETVVTEVTKVNGVFSPSFPTPPFTLEFTGGKIRLRNTTGRVKEHFFLQCDMLDTLTIEVVEIPAEG